MTNPKLALTGWREIERSLRSARHIALLTDFDGTLGPIRDEPGQVRLPLRTRRSLRAISRAGMPTAIISGRGLRDVQDRVRISGIWYSGSHGLAISAPGGARRYLASPAQRRRMELIATKISRQLGGRPGLSVEIKDGCLAVHYRRAAWRDRVWCHKLVGTVLAEFAGIKPQVVLHAGKCVWEILPDAPHSKWSAVQLILRRAGFRPGGTVIYLGDDVADENVFRRLREMPRRQLTPLTFLVGAARPSHARYRLRGVDEASEFLSRLARIVA